MEYAPILISVYIRIDHLKKCIESLKANDIAQESILYVVSDAAYKKDHIDFVTEIRKYLRQISGFKMVNLIERKENLGSTLSIKNAIDEIVNLYGRIIFLEDDNVVSTNFLSFVNTGLELYKDRNDIFSISGYNSPLEMPNFYKQDVYLRKDFVAWGVGLWKNRWERVDWSMNEFNSFVDNKKEFAKLSRNKEEVVSQFLMMRNNGTLLIDGLFVSHLYIKDMYSIYPVQTRVRNHGHDGSGEHCGNNSKFINQKIYDQEDDAIFPPNLEPNQKLLDFIRRNYKITFTRRVKRKIPNSIKKKLKSVVKNKFGSHL